jgi:Barrier to autointegration factor
MSTTSMKHKSFVSEPMGEKPCTELAGVGPVLGSRLEAKGFDKVFMNFDVYNQTSCIVNFKSFLST